jgi:hypothetical protein
MEEHRLQGFENKVLRKRSEKHRKWKILHNKELNDLYGSLELLVDQKLYKTGNINGE